MIEYTVAPRTRDAQGRPLGHCVVDIEVQGEATLTEIVQLGLVLLRTAADYAVITATEKE